MKLKPIAFLKSLNWVKEDIKKILIFIIMLLIACFILDNFLLIKVKIIHGRIIADTAGGFGGRGF